MKIEHFALNVAAPSTMAGWYCRHLGFHIARRNHDAADTHFLATGEGGVMIEIYRHPAAPVPDYVAKNPLELHLAFSVENPAAEIARLREAGATIAAPLAISPRGDQLAMLRDPFGVALQLVKRREPMRPDAGA